MPVDIHPERSRIELTDLSKDDRSRLRPIAGACAAGALVAALLYLAFWPSKAQAAEVFRDKDDRGGPAVLKLSDKPCTNAKVRAHLFDKLLDDRRFKAATLFYWGREWAACWVDRNGIVHSMDEQGAPLQPVPRTAFKDDAV